jgi:hypothetical protein
VTSTVPPVERSPTRLGSVRTLRWGLVGQVLTFLAMVVPIALQETGQVIVLALASSVAGLLVNISTLAYGYVFPVIRGRRLAATATVVSAATLTGTALLVLAGGTLENRFDLPTGSAAATAALLWSQGLYTMLTAALIRRHDTGGLGITRVAYGVVVLVATLLVSLLPVGPLGLVLATSLAYLLTVVLLGATGRPLLHLADVPRAHLLRRLGRAHVRRAVRPTLSGAAAGWAYLFSGLSLVGLGVYGAPWAVVNRICGGYGTLLQTVLSPPVEAQLSRAVRDQDVPALLKARRSGLLLGTGVAVLAVGSSLVLALYSVGLDDADRWFLPVLAATLLFWAPQLITTPINRLANFLGRHRSRLVWDAVRAVAITAAFLATEGITRLLVMGAVIALSGALLLPISRPVTTRQTMGLRHA